MSKGLINYALEVNISLFVDYSYALLLLRKNY